MKKYVKPVLIYESFAMAQQIAACDFDLVEGTSTDISCQFHGVGEMGEMTIFTSNCGENDASVRVEDGSFCYHNSVSVPIGIFNS